jgi:hypothetical protein
LSDQADTLLPVDGQFLYRYFDESGGALYNGRSNDWTRRLREHWREDIWSSGITSVTVERYQDLTSVIAAEAASIREEHPRYNVQHNRPGIAAGDLSAGRQWAAEDIILMIGLAVLVGYLVYKGTAVAVEKYRCWKAEQDEFRAWKQVRAELIADEPAMSMEFASVIVAEPVVVAVDEPPAAAPEPTVIIPKPPAPTPYASHEPAGGLRASRHAVQAAPADCRLHRPVMATSSARNSVSGSVTCRQPHGQQSSSLTR